MSKQLSRPNPPRGLLRMFMRAPLWLYRLRLGWLMGDRFVMLTHIGRKSGLARQTVLEVVQYKAATDSYLIVSGWGERADWLQNIQKTPRVLLDTGRRRVEATVTRLTLDEATRAFYSYAQQHPVAFRQMSRFLAGEQLGTSMADCERIAQQMPMVAVRPKTG